MIRMLNAVFLISGTAIGAGLIALPLTAVNLSITTLLAIIAVSVLTAYKSSMMTIDLIECNGKSASIVELSKTMSGPSLFTITLLSFYILSFALLSVYFAGAADTIRAFLGLNMNILIPICSVFLFVVLRLKISLFSAINSVLFSILIAAIFIVMLSICGTTSFQALPVSDKYSEIISFVPIIFTSFGVQNICPNIYEYLQGDRSKISKAFLIGILVPAIIYVAWILCVFQNVITINADFFLKVQNHQVSAGELIKFLCQSSHNVYVEIFFKILSLFAIATSALGIGIGLLKSLKEHVNTKIAPLAVCIVPALSAILIPNAFINILSFGGMIATVFVIFVPFFLQKHRGAGEIACLIVGIAIVICEIFEML